VDLLVRVTDVQSRIFTGKEGEELMDMDSAVETRYEVQAIIRNSVSDPAVV